VPVDTGHARVVYRRSAVLRTEELQGDPCRLRENLDELFALLRDVNPRVRRSILRMFGELVARWQERQLGTPISVVVEFQPDVVRMTFRHPQAPLMPAAWEELISPIILDYVDSWGIDRGNAGNAWFEFRDPAIARRIAAQPQQKHRRPITGRADLSSKARLAAAN
jgi:AcrR family transcriptional regulator